MFVVLVSALLLASADAAPEAAVSPIPAAPAASPPAAKPKQPNVTCWVEMPTGSHLAKRICATREELDKAERDAKSAMDVRNSGERGGMKPR